MAFGFIKKIFSFGKKQVEEVLAEADASEAQQAQAEAPVEATPAPAAPVAEVSSPPRGEVGEAKAEPGEGEKPAEATAPAQPAPAPAEAPPPPPPAPEKEKPEQKAVLESPKPAKDDVPAKEPKPNETPKPAAPVAEKPAHAKKAPPKEPEPAPEKPRAKKEPKPEAPAETAEATPEKAAEPKPAPTSPSMGGKERSDEVREKANDLAFSATNARSESEGQPAKRSDAGGDEPAAQPTPTPALRADPPHKGEGGTGRVTVSRSVERATEAAPAPEPEQPKTSWLQRLRSGLSRSSKELSSSISGVFTKRKLDEDTLQDLEDILIRADLGAETAMRIADTLSASRYGRDVSDAEVRGVMASEIEKVLSPVAQALELDLSHKPHVVLVVGVNGTGKTTTIGKLAAKLVSGGLSVTLAAGDTFRAAAIEQLKIWGERTGSPVVSSKLGADAAGLAWDAYEQAKEAGSDVLIIDTAGRLQNKAELMAELEKIVRVLGKHDPEAPHTVLLTVDATTGQNALNQVEIFRNVAGVNGLVMTKLDGTARGGILVAIAAKHKLPVYFIGVGEQVDDLEPFSAHDFAAAIAGTETA
jgi:fused signal recognition particle receptor